MHMFKHSWSQQQHFQLSGASTCTTARSSLPCPASYQILLLFVWVLTVMPL